MTHRCVIASTVVAIGIAGFVAGCSSNNETSGPRGSLAITIGATGAPAVEAVPTATGGHEDALAHLKAAVVTVAGLEARLADGTWVPVDTGLPADLDLIAIMNAGKVRQLPTDLFPEGDYDALQLRVTQVQLTRVDDIEISLAPPGSGWTVQIPVNVSVVAGRSTVVGLTLRCGSSFSLIDGQFAFDPEIEVEGVQHD